MSQTFVNISTVFDSPEERTVSKLASVYNEMDFLKQTIKKTISSRLTREKVEGKKVLLKPNWVKHSHQDNDEICLRTHDRFVLAALSVILEWKPERVTIGDAPIQGCNWNKMISEELISEIQNISEENGVEVILKDFRRRTYNFSENNPDTEVRPISDYHIYDLGTRSHLEEISKPGETNFRVTNYDPDRMGTAHSRGIHKYCIIKEFFESDLVITLPKLKTHQKAGITGALKNLVGINGDKDFLPHHRIGGTNIGGDCYPGGSKFRYWSELCIDRANRRQGKKSFWFWQKISSLFWRLSLPGPEHSIEAGWYGNDTTWRMVLDLNQIGYYGKTDGSISRTRQRDIFSLSDGIVGGQGNGPLFPDPLALGVVMFSDNPAFNDIAASLLMGLDYSKIPLLIEAEKLFSSSGYEIRLNNESIRLQDLKDISVSAEPPRGWVKYMK